MLKFAEIREIFEKYGVDLVGAIPFEKVEEHLLNTRNRARIVQNSKSVIIAAFCYNVGQKPINMAKYNAVRDYHLVINSISQKVCDEILKQNSEVNFAFFGAASPIPEVQAATILGLGVRGKNNLLITKKYGSYVNIGSIVLDCELDEYSDLTEPKSCKECGKCFAACPTNAISQGGFKRDLCISNIAYKKHLDDDDIKVLKAQKSVLGCDLCQDCCPMNEGINLTKIKEFYEDVREIYLPNEDPTGRTYEYFAKAQIERNYKILSED